MVKPPFSMRQSREANEEFAALRDGISAGLKPSLLEWVMPFYIDQDERNLTGLKIVDKELVRQLERKTDKSILPDEDAYSLEALRLVFGADWCLLLDAIDFVLPAASTSSADGLETMFMEARSDYCVGKDGQDTYELQYRQLKEMTEFMEAVASSSGRASEHLREAWSQCFGRNPEPDDAFAHAVKAIEVAAKPVIIPDDTLATLGKICSAMRDKPSKWETVPEFEGSIETVLSIMDMVWKGQLRHGDEDAPLEVSQEAAEMTVQTAVLLVSWFRSGRVRLRS